MSITEGCSPVALLAAERMGKSAIFCLGATHITDSSSQLHTYLQKEWGNEHDIVDTRKGPHVAQFSNMDSFFRFHGLYRELF